MWHQLQRTLFHQQPIYHLSNLPPPPSIVDGPNVIEPDILKPPGMRVEKERAKEKVLG